MSWDVLVSNGAEAPPEFGEPQEGWQPPPLGSPSEVRAKISECLPDVDWREPAWGIYSSGELTIEFNIGSDDPIDSLMLHVRGEGDALGVIADLCKSLSWSALDLSTCEELDFENPSPEGWNDLKRFRNDLSSVPDHLPGDLPTRRSHRR